MDSEIKAFLSNRQNLSLAWDITDSFEEMSEHVYLTFWQNVQKYLENFVLEQDYSDQWEVCFDEEDCSELFIKPRGLAEGTCAFQVCAQSLNGEPYGACYFGIYRGKEVKRASWTAIDKKLSEVLTADGFGSTKWWPGYKKIKTVGLPEMDGEAKEELLDLNDDNCDDKHPLATTAAQAIIKLFEKHRSTLETLNQSYPY